MIRRALVAGERGTKTTFAQSEENRPRRGKPASASKHTFYQPELDGLRLLAFLFVFCSHLPGKLMPKFFDAGSFGLGVFFMLSAYLIVKLLLKEKARTGVISVRAFIIRRVLRIWPLYFFAIGLNAVVGKAWPPAHVARLGNLAFLLLATNVYILKRSWALGMIAPLWSICIEEQFYFLVPWVGRLSGRRGMTAFFLGVLVLAYVVLGFLGHQHADHLGRVWPNSFVEFQFFAVGALLALWDKDLQLSILARSFLFTAGIGLWIVANARYEVHAWTEASSAYSLVLGYTLVLAGTVALFLSVLHLPVKLPRPMLYLGTISYGLYVYHCFWVAALWSPWASAHLASLGTRFLPTVLALVLTIATAAVSYRFFEKPVLKLKERFEIVPTRQR